jgi:sugar O-acyltransferase (sialic acid O-acetyltransferase NeuD family)
VISHLAILGAGAHARETYWHVMDAWPSTAICFVDDITDCVEVSMAGRSIPVAKDWRLPAAYRHFLIGVGSPASKRLLVEKALAAGLAPAPTLIHPRATVQAPDIRVGAGGLIAPGCVLTTHIDLGDFVILNLNATVAHDCRIGDFATCGAGCHLSGHVTIGEGAFLGAGVAVRESTAIAPWATVGAQAYVARSLQTPGATYVGVPARLLRGPATPPPEA